MKQRINAKSYGLGSRLSADVFLAYSVDANLSCGDREKYSIFPACAGNMRLRFQAEEESVKVESKAKIFTTKGTER